MIDAHQHFWTPSRDDYGWLSVDDAVLYREFGPEDLAPWLEGAGVSRSIVVQAAPTVAETRYLLGIADRTPWVAGVVGWVDLSSPDVERELDTLVAHRAFVGVRPMIQDLPDDAWMLGPGLDRGFRALVERGLCFDALVLPRHLPHLMRLLARHPDLRVVVDHAAKPAIADGRLAGWAADIERIAEDSDAYCKLSGLVTEAANEWQTADLVPVVDRLLSSFGSERLLWGSDWPVVELAGGFGRWRQATLELLDALDETDRAAILGGTAERFYRLAPA